MIREIRKKKCQIGLPRSEGSTRPELILVSIRVFLLYPKLSNGRENETEYLVAFY